MIFWFVGVLLTDKTQKIPRKYWSGVLFFWFSWYRGTLWFVVPSSCWHNEVAIVVKCSLALLIVHRYFFCLARRKWWGFAIYLHECLACLFEFTYFQFTLKCSLIVLSAWAAKVNCKWKYCKLLGGLDESPHRICFQVPSAFVRARACIHVNLWPERVFWGFFWWWCHPVGPCVSQVSAPSFAPIEGKAM